MNELINFARKIVIADVGEDEEDLRLEATDADLITLADRLEVPGVERAVGHASFWRTGPVLYVEGKVEADLIRECVATLEEMEENISETFSVSYTTAPQPEDLPDEVEADLDAPEFLETPTLELADVFVEQIVLAMKPHPRKEGAEVAENIGPGAEISPFDILKKMKGNDNEGN